MNETRTLEIALPADAELADHELATLRIACEALAQLACGAGTSPRQVTALAAEGWQVSSTLTWIARAERGKDYEEAVGADRCEALCRLCEEVGLRAVEGCP